MQLMQLVLLMLLMLIVETTSFVIVCDRMEHVPS